jgi:hypothetical protein
VLSHLSRDVTAGRTEHPPISVWIRDGASGFLFWETAQPGTTEYLTLEWMQKGSRTEPTGGILFRSLEAKWKFRLEKVSS